MVFVILHTSYTCLFHRRCFALCKVCFYLSPSFLSSLSFILLMDIQLVGSLGQSNPVNHTNKIKPYCCDSNSLGHSTPPSLSVTPWPFSFKDVTVH